MRRPRTGAASVAWATAAPVLSRSLQLELQARTALHAIRGAMQSVEGMAPGTFEHTLLAATLEAFDAGAVDLRMSEVGWVGPVPTRAEVARAMGER